jgi:hypothetical protein
MTFVSVPAFSNACAETLVASDAHSRLSLAFKVADAQLQKHLPPGWLPNPPTAGPMKDANLLLSFVDRLINLDPDGKPVAGGRDRYVVVAVPVKESATGATGSMVIRSYTGNERILPGAYGTTVLADIHHEANESGSNVDGGHATTSWQVRSGDAGSLSLTLRYPHGPQARMTAEQKVYSPLRPDFHRIYRSDQVTEVVKSVPSNVDRVEALDLKVELSEFADLFDGAQQLIGITVAPWVARKIYLP